MKDYIFRLKQGCKTGTFVLWWMFRALILFAFVSGFSGDSFTVTGQIHIAVCFIASFWWELSLAMGSKSLFRLMPSSIHTIINAGLTVSAFCGVYLNMYYTFRCFDPVMQAFFSFVSVLYGYEIAYAIIRRDRFSATKAMAFFVAFGISFLSFNIWELGEFFTDQLVGHLTGEVGNAQFWSVMLSEGTARAESVIPSLVDARAPLMDIMCDVIVHSVSAFAALIFINLYPYRLRGRFSYETDYANNLVAVKNN